MDPVGWVHAAFLIGAKDWAAATDTQWLWEWLAVRPRLRNWQLRLPQTRRV